MRINLPLPYDAARERLVQALDECVRVTIDRTIEADCDRGSSQWVALEDVVPKSRIEPISNGFRYRHQRASLGHWLRFRRPDKGGFEHFVWIMYRNRKDLLLRALESVDRSSEVHGVIVFDFSGQLEGKELSYEHSLYRVTDPKTTVTVMRNWVRELAIEHGIKFAIQMHSDAKVSSPLLRQLIADSRMRKRWGRILCPSEAFASYSVEAMKDTGVFDENFPFRGASEDYAYRMSLRGWELARIEADYPDFEHEGSATINADAKLRLDTETQLSFVRAHYRHKWGGTMGSEKNTRPYGVK